MSDRYRQQESIQDGGVGTVLDRDSEMVLAQFRDGLIITDAAGRVLHMNRAARRMCDIAPDEDVRRRLSDFAQRYEAVDDQGAEVSLDSRVIDRAVAGQGPSAFESWLHDKQTGKRWFISATTTPVTGPDGRLRFVVHSLRDLTQREQLYTELERRNRELQDFASIASHDLMAPLRLVSGYLDLIREELGSDGDQDLINYLQRALDATGRMRRLIDDLMAYAQLGHRGPPRLEQVDANAVLREALDNIDLLVEESEAEVVIADLAPVCANPSMLRQGFQNLLANAIKYCDKRPRIEVFSTPGETTGHVRLCVKDNGPGIEAQYQDHIFAPFTRLDRPLGVEGSGIGLAFCRKIADFCHGSIGLESEPGNGATFYFDLPQQVPEP